jgi:hypothetical protein
LALANNALSGRIPVSPRSRRGLALATLTIGLTAAAPAVAGAAQVSGRVLAAHHPVPGAQVTLYAAGTGAPATLGHARSNARGRFAIRYARAPRGAVLYAQASGGRTPARGALRLMAVADPSTTPRRLVLNELTTVAAAYALAQFLDGGQVSGPAPGLRNAAATVPSLVRPATGTVGAAIATAPNGTQTDSLATFGTLADVLAGCTGGGPVACRALFRAARPAGGTRPANTLDAVHAIALNPASNVNAIYRLARAHAYRPVLRSAPSSWVLTLKHTDGGYDGPGRMAFDSVGNIWVTNNFEPPGTDAGLGVISLDPTGRARNGSPVTGGGIRGNWWGIAIDRQDRVWLSNFTGADPAEFYSPDFKGGIATSLFAQDGTALSPPTGFLSGDLHAPQGIAVDQSDNVWIANHGTATVTVYPGGDPRQARVVSGGGLYNPFTVAIDGAGNAWVDNGSLDPSAPGSVTKITPDGQAVGPIVVDNMHSPQGMALDSAGDLWIASLVDNSITWLGQDGTVKGQFRARSIEGPWGVAVDGDDNVWVASFLGQKVTKLCGRTVANCPAGSRTGDPISPPLHGFTNGGLQHVTAVQIDASGNAWVANNWAQISPIVGGDGLVEFIGAAAPVATPMIGPPRRP